MTIKQMQDRKAWLNLRKEGLGGTDAAVIMGMSKFKTLHRLWAEKTGRFQPEELSNDEAVHFGAVLEEVVAEEFTIRTGKKVKKHGLLRSMEHPWMLASVDRILIGEDAGLECKTASFLMRKEWEDGHGKFGGIPEGYYCQCQWYMAVTGFPRWYIACLIGGQHYVWRIVERDEAFISEMVKKASVFWMNVTNDTLPSVDCTEDCGRNLSAFYSAVQDKEVRLPEAMEHSFVALGEIEERLEELGERKVYHENRIKSCLKDAEYGRTDSGYYASWKKSKRCYKGTDIAIRSFRYGKGAAGT